MSVVTSTCEANWPGVGGKGGRKLRAKYSFERQIAEVFKRKLNKLAATNFHCQDKSLLFVMERKKGKINAKKLIFILALVVYFRVWKSFFACVVKREKNISMETRGQKVKILYFLLERLASC